MQIILTEEEYKNLEDKFKKEGQEELQKRIDRLRKELDNFFISNKIPPIAAFHREKFNFDFAKFIEQVLPFISEL